jgi:hypothetical protein
MGFKYWIWILLVLPALVFSKPQTAASYHTTCHISKMTHHHSHHSSGRDATLRKVVFNPFYGRKRKIILPVSFHNHIQKEVKTLLKQYTAFDADVRLSPSALWKVNKDNLNHGKGGQLVERNVVKVE